MFNMTMREARQRANYYNGSIVYDPDYNEYRVGLREWTRKERDDRSYYTDDLEDAVLTLAHMRRNA